MSLKAQTYLLVPILGFHWPTVDSWMAEGCRSKLTIKRQITHQHITNRSKLQQPFPIPFFRLHKNRNDFWEVMDMENWIYIDLVGGMVQKHRCWNGLKKQIGKVHLTLNLHTKKKKKKSRIKRVERIRKKKINIHIYTCIYNRQDDQLLVTKLFKLQHDLIKTKTITLSL